MAEFVPTRTELQVRTHAQKYLAKMQQGLPFPQEVCVRAREREGGRENVRASSSVPVGAYEQS